MREEVEEMEEVQIVSKKISAPKKKITKSSKSKAKNNKKGK
jgi:hypothetical protein